MGFFFVAFFFTIFPSGNSSKILTLVIRVDFYTQDWTRVQECKKKTVIERFGVWDMCP